MEKKQNVDTGPRSGMAKKSFLPLKAAVCLVFLAILASMGQVNAQKPVSVSLKNATLEEVFEVLGRQTGYHFAYSLTMLERAGRVNVEARGKDFGLVLDQCLEGSGLVYKIDGENVLISRQNPQNARQTDAAARGRVRNKAGVPLSGVSVFMKGSPRGAVTDATGQFSLAVPQDGAVVLVFSMIGHRTAEIAFDPAKTTGRLNVTLEEEQTEMDRVVVTGIFNKSRESYTGAVSSITAKEIALFKGQNLISTLKNIDPSLNVFLDNLDGSNPNVVPQVNIRGNSSLPMSVSEFNEGVRQQVNTPLIIMDGFEISLQKMMDYNDEEIQSINILKDASATAIYGSRGANGVIVVVSKAPQAGRLKVSLQAGINLEIPDLSSYRLLDARGKLELERLAGVYEATVPRTHLTYQKLYNERLKDVLGGADTYWLGKPVRTGVGQKYNARMEGGGEEFKWGVTLGYTDTEGAMKGSSRKNFNGGIILSYSYKDLIFRNQTNIGWNKGTESNYGSLSDYAAMQPYNTPYDANGNVRQFFWDTYHAGKVGNPLYDATLNSFDRSKYDEVINNFSIEWSITQALKLRAQFGISHRTNMSDRFLPAEHSAFLDSRYQSVEGSFRKGSYDYSVGEDSNYDGNVTMSYSRQFADRHQLYAGLDFSLSQRDTYAYYISAEGFSNEDLAFLGNALQYAKDGKPTGTEDFSRRMGVTGNVNYTYDNRYFADFSLRLDGSSQFGTDNKFAPFWSAGIGWNVHNEHFMPVGGWLNTLRLRASVGQTGSQQFSAYQALETFRYYTDNKYAIWNAAELMGFGNKDLKWQVTDQYNIGAEFTVLGGRLSGSADVYVKKTSNLLSQMDIPLATGFPSYVDNVGEVRNSGFEGSLSGYLVRNPERGITWMASAKLVYNRNRITRLSDAVKTQNEEYMLQEVDVNNLFYEGGPQHAIYAVRSLGIDPSSGREMYLDKNGLITEEWLPSAKVYLGSAEPAWRGNASTMFTWRNLSVNLSFGYRWGGMAYNQTLRDKVEVTGRDIAAGNVDRRVLEQRWMREGDLVYFRKIGILSSTYHATSRFVMKERVFELQSASVQYRLDGGWLKENNISSVILGVNMSDVFYISSIKRERGIAYPFASRMGATVSLMF